MLPEEPGGRYQISKQDSVQAALIGNRDIQTYPLSGFPSKHILGVPGCFPLDIMHLPALNIPNLFTPLWRGTFECAKTDSKDNWGWAVLRLPAVWKAHGKMVTDATPYIPGSFDRPPRNPAERPFVNTFEVKARTSQTTGLHT